jgi:hypothetical protein
MPLPKFAMVSMIALGERQGVAVLLLLFSKVRPNQYR